MRMIVALPLLMLAACNVDRDARNDQVTVGFDENQIEDTADDLSNAAERAASEVGEAAENAGQAIQDEVGDIDVDVDINRNKSDDSN